MFQKIVVPLIGNASLRLSLGSGSIRATAEDRDGVLIDGKSPHFAGAEIDDDGVVDVAVAGGGGKRGADGASRHGPHTRNAIWAGHVEGRIWRRADNDREWIH